MAIRKIARMGHPILGQRTAPVQAPDAPEVRRLIADMIETLADAGGIGLAAPQVHESLRLMIYRVPAVRNAGQEVPLTVLINPDITPLDEGRAHDWESCLSLPGLTGSVPRHRAVAVTALDLDGAPMAFEARDFHARVLQHEGDHLDGILYPQRLDDPGQFGFVEEIRQTLARQGTGS